MTTRDIPEKNKLYWTNEEPHLISGRVEMQPTSKSLCIIDGLGFGVTADGFNYCTGPVDLNGKSVTDIATDAHQTAPDNENSVAKPPTSKELHTNNIQAQNNEGFATSKNNGGRPRKKDNFSRYTKWRRDKEAALQGKLL